MDFILSLILIALHEGMCTKELRKQKANKIRVNKIFCKLSKANRIIIKIPSIFSKYLAMDDFFDRDNLDCRWLFIYNWMCLWESTETDLCAYLNMKVEKTWKRNPIWWVYVKMNDKSKIILKFPEGFEKF